MPIASDSRIATLLRKGFIGQILEKSEGVFLYAERFCDDVQRGHLSLDRSEQFPQGLGGIFCQWVLRQFPDLEKFRKDVRPALRTILAAREPLPVEILQRLFHWQDEELRDFTRTGNVAAIVEDAVGGLAAGQTGSAVEITNHTHPTHEATKAQSAGRFARTRAAHRERDPRGARRRQSPAPRRQGGVRRTGTDPALPRA